VPPYTGSGNPFLVPVFCTVQPLGAEMANDFEDYLVRSAFAGVGSEPECWHVAQMNDRVLQKRDIQPPKHLRDFYIWLITTTDIPAEKYRVTRLSK
jgi:hypothetical protein